MYKTTVKIDGMMCGMCESHINDAIRAKMPVKKVSSSHKKGETVIIGKAKPPNSCDYLASYDVI
jgi:copper chaperone CopZ